MRSSNIEGHIIIDEHRCSDERLQKRFINFFRTIANYSPLAHCFLIGLNRKNIIERDNFEIACFVGLCHGNQFFPPRQWRKDAPGQSQRRGHWRWENSQGENIQGRSFVMLGKISTG